MILKFLRGITDALANSTGTLLREDKKVRHSSKKTRKSRTRAGSFLDPSPDEKSDAFLRSSRMPSCERQKELQDWASAYVEMSFAPDTEHVWLPSIEGIFFAPAKVEKIVLATGLDLMGSPAMETFFDLPRDEKWEASSLGFLRQGYDELRSCSARIDACGDLIDANEKRVLRTREQTQPVKIEDVYAVLAALLAEFAPKRLAMLRAIDGESRRRLNQIIKRLRAVCLALKHEDTRLAARLGSEAIIAVNHGFSRRLEAVMQTVDGKEEDDAAYKSAYLSFTEKLGQAYFLLFGREAGQNSTHNRGPYIRFASAFYECAGCQLPLSSIGSHLTDLKRVHRKTDRKVRKSPSDI